MIGYLPEQVYVPTSLSMDLPISYYFLNSCQECLCRAIKLTTLSFMAINCLTISHLCLFYTNYATNFTVKWNSTAYLYFLYTPPNSMIIMNTQMATLGAYTTGIATGFCSPPSSGYIAMITDTSNIYQFYSYMITTQYTGDANLKFIFQGDSTALWHLDNISLTMSNGNNYELLINGDFENYSNGWTLSCSETCVTGSSGLLTFDSCHSGSLCFMDGCTGAVDFISQSVYLQSGIVYNLTFWLYLNTSGDNVPLAYISLH